MIHTNKKKPIRNIGKRSDRIGENKPTSVDFKEPKEIKKDTESIHKMVDDLHNAVADETLVSVDKRKQEPDKIEKLPKENPKKLDKTQTKLPD